MDVEPGVGADWSGRAWEPVDGAARHAEVQVLRVERALARGYPALTRALGSGEVESLARELIAAHPFLSGASSELPEVIRVFLGAALEDDKRRGAWLAELARLEEAYEAVRKAAPADPGDQLAGGRLLAFEHRVDVLREQLLCGGIWVEPAPQPVLLAVVGGREGPRTVELSQEQWVTFGNVPIAAAPRRGPRAGRATPPKPSAARTGAMAPPRAAWLCSAHDPE